jgi:arginyl-tRNA--protein-N-Asp/Glu arginylyltransferase
MKKYHMEAHQQNSIYESTFQAFDNTYIERAYNIYLIHNISTHTAALKDTPDSDL